MELDTKLEGILFYKAESMHKTDVSEILGCTHVELTTAIETLRQRLTGSIRILETETHIGLVTAPELSEFLETVRRDELKRDIGKAGAETLSIVLYRGPITRSEIDFVRGVNSSFILRNLMVRGLVMREPNPKDQRALQYSASPELLMHLGVTRREDLPDYQTIQNELDRIEKETREGEVLENVSNEVTVSDEKL